MVQIVGTYKHSGTAPNFKSYLKALGVPDSELSNVANGKPTITVSENNGQWTFHSSDAGREWSSTFKLGEPYDENTFNGVVLKSVTKREGDKLITESTLADTEDTKVYEFHETGITVHISNKKFPESTSTSFTRV